MSDEVAWQRYENALARAEGLMKERDAALARAEAAEREVERMLSRALSAEAQRNAACERAEAAEAALGATEDHYSQQAAALLRKHEARIRALEEALREASQYVRDAGDDEDPETQRHANALLEKIAALNEVSDGHD